jgi:hypothetical protein
MVLHPGPHSRKHGFLSLNGGLLPLEQGLLPRIELVLLRDDSDLPLHEVVNPAAASFKTSLCAAVQGTYLVYGPSIYST